MDRRVTVEVGVPAQDSAGQPIIAWAERARVWAERTAVGGSERFASQQIVAEADTRFVMRHRDDISPRETLRILGDAGRYYDVKRVEEIGRRAGLTIWAKARTE
jgi:SPP1 family predicted phage head-tail adaptor